MSEKSAVERAKDALNDWPVSIHPRLGLGPTSEGIFDWYCKHASTIREALEQAAECGCVTHDDCKGAHSTCKQSLQVDASAIVQDCYKNVRMLSRHDNFERLTHIQMTVDYLYAKGLLSREGAWNGKFKRGDRVRKIKGASWSGNIVGFYSTHLTPIGYAVESEWEVGSVQIYPEAALEPAPPLGDKL